MSSNKQNAPVASRCLIVLFAALVVTGCDRSDKRAGSGAAADADRGGPDDLIGLEWTGDPVSIGGISFEYGFRFDATTVTVTNTCGGSLTAKATAPVRYRYEVSVPRPGTQEETRGGQSCVVAVADRTFEFEIVGEELHGVVDGETFVFEAIGGPRGLYGTWGAADPEVGELKWTMGGGKISATAECSNGLTARVEVDADFTNLLEIPEGARETATDGHGATCEAAIEAGTIEYFFEGADLVMVNGGEQTVFHRG